MQMLLVENVTGGTNGSIDVLTDGHGFHLRDRSDGRFIEVAPGNQTAAIARATAILAAGLANTSTFWTGSVLQVIHGRRGYSVQRQDSGVTLESFSDSVPGSAAAVAKATQREATGNTF